MSWQYFKQFTPRRPLAVMLSAVLLAGAGACDSGSGAKAEGKAPDKVTYLTSFGSFGREAFAYIAKQKGFFSDENIDATIEPGQGVSSNFQLMAAGKAQFSANDLSGAWVLQGDGKYPQMRTIAAIHQRTLLSIITLAGNKISAPKDLVGHTIGGLQGAGPELLFPVYAKLTGIDASKVTWKHMTATLITPSLASGAVDAVGQFVVAAPTLEKAAKGRKTITLAYSDVIDDLYGNGLVTTDALIKSNPDLVSRFRSALLKGLQWSVENPDEAGQILHQMVPTQDAATAAAELKMMGAYVVKDGQVGEIDESRVARSVAVLAGAGVIPKAPAPENLVDLDFATGAGATASPSAGS